MSSIESVLVGGVYGNLGTLFCPIFVCHSRYLSDETSSSVNSYFLCVPFHGSSFMEEEMEL